MRSPELLVVNYHYISDRFYPRGGIYPCSQKQLISQIEIIVKSYVFVTLQDVYNYYYIHGSSLPQKCCLLTFDDGLREHYDVVWPILQQKGIPAAFFINTHLLDSFELLAVHKLHWLNTLLGEHELTRLILKIGNELDICFKELNLLGNDFIHQYRYDNQTFGKLKYFINFRLSTARRKELIDLCYHTYQPNPQSHAATWYMSPKNWEDLGKQGFLGTHTHNHFSLASLEKREIHSEISRSLMFIEAYTKKQPFAISYPYGGPQATSTEVITACKCLGLSIGFTMERHINHLASASPLLLGRYDTNDIPGGNMPLLHF